MGSPPNPTGAAGCGAGCAKDRGPKRSVTASLRNPGLHARGPAVSLKFKYKISGLLVPYHTPRSYVLAPGMSFFSWSSSEAGHWSSQSPATLHMKVCKRSGGTSAVDSMLRFIQTHLPKLMFLQYISTLDKSLLSGVWYLYYFPLQAFQVEM